VRHCPARGDQGEGGGRKGGQRAATLVLLFGVVTWCHGTTAPLPAQTSQSSSSATLDDTSKGRNARQFTYFELTGSSGIFTGLSTEFADRAWDLPEPDAARLVSSQPAPGIVRLAAVALGAGPRGGGTQLAALDVDIRGGSRMWWSSMRPTCSRRCATLGWGWASTWSASTRMSCL